MKMQGEIALAYLTIRRKTMEKRKQVVAYVRVATQEQENSSCSLEAQKKTLSIFNC